MKTSMASIALLSAVALLALVFEADAASVRVRCESRADRSKISVDGSELVDGVYSAHVISGSNEADSADVQMPVGGQVEFDFDSDPGDIAAGATAIAVDFIQGNVTGQILDDTGFVVTEATAVCRVR